MTYIRINATIFVSASVVGLIVKILQNLGIFWITKESKPNIFHDKGLPISTQVILNIHGNNNVKHGHAQIIGWRSAFPDLRLHPIKVN